MRSKIGVIFLVSVLALAGIGISYAGWTDSIAVSGTVQTGKVMFEVTEYSGTWVWKQISTHGKITHTGSVAATDLNEDGKLNDDPNGFYGNNDYELVAYSYAHNSVQTVNEQVYFEFVNLFPCVDFSADFKFTIGTIPVFLTATQVVWTNEKINNVPTPWINGIPDAPVPTIGVKIYDAAGNQIYPTTADKIQLHPGVTYTWVLTIHIPQDNAYMNAYAEGSASMSIIQWSDDCGDGQLPGKTVNLPTCLVDAYYTHVGNGGAYISYWDITLSGVPGNQGDYNVWNQLYDGWCVSQYIYINPPGPYKVRLWSSLEYSSNPNFPWPGNHWPTDQWDWPCVNYILNHRGDYPTAGYMDFQNAIWYFVDGGVMPPNPSIAYNIVQDAINNVQTWYLNYPQTGDRVAVLCQVCDANGNPLNIQHCFIDVDP